MKMPISIPIGAKVSVIAKAYANEVHLIGHGIYEGFQMHPEGFQSPRILLDDKRIVWGCDFWWGTEDKINRWIGARKIIQVQVEEEIICSQ